ncbi:unnamed protein product [Gordionus sp. m RMFG-2023]|uniref:keratin-associated protein 5-8-like n=1 Tax=Gordionus sp. m RMFG-2023 TaxID=3053472 RepID=UPI0030E3AC29
METQEGSVQPCPEGECPYKKDGGTCPCSKCVCPNDCCQCCDMDTKYEKCQICWHDEACHGCDKGCCHCCRKCSDENACPPGQESLQCPECGVCCNNEKMQMENKSENEN